MENQTDSLFLGTEKLSKLMVKFCLSLTLSWVSFWAVSLFGRKTFRIFLMLVTFTCTIKMAGKLTGYARLAVRRKGEIDAL